MRQILYCALLVWLSTFNSQLSTVFAQGALTPPGAPAPTMKTLTQIEPRTPISSAPFTITNPGAYYLTANLAVSTGDAIDINANEVTLDLEGFTISSTAASATGTGISVSGTNVTILNGHVRGGVTNNGSGTFGGGGFSSGIYGAYGSYNIRVSGVTVSGCLAYGIFLPGNASTLIESCAAQNIGGYGLYADAVCRSTVSGAYQGVVARVASDCYANCYGEAIGTDDAANNCVGISSSSTGVYCGGCANNCYGYSSTFYGIQSTAAHNCRGISEGNAYGILADVVTDSSGYSNSNTGIYAIETACGCYAYGSSGTLGVYVLNALNASYCTARPYNNNSAINATVATGCYAAAGTNNILYKYNMP